MRILGFTHTWKEVQYYPSYSCFWFSGHIPPRIPNRKVTSYYDFSNSLLSTVFDENCRHYTVAIYIPEEDRITGMNGVILAMDDFK